MPPGQFGENSTTEGIDVTRVLVGELASGLGRPEGHVAAGDSIDVISRPEHSLTIYHMARIYLFEHNRSSELLVPKLPQSWREWVLKRLRSS